jgi:hypothetical protein
MSDSMTASSAALYAAPEVLTYFAQPGPMTNPGDYGAAFDALSSEIGPLCRAVQGVMLHIFWAERYGVKLSESRKGEVQIRPVDAKLRRLFELDPRPLTEARAHESKLVGNCRDFAVMTTAVLRYHGVPARARCGFATYFIPDHYEDHWITEYWSAGEARWILFDPQLDAMMCDVLKLDFDPHDVPRDRFIVAGQGWQRCRRGEADPDAFGIFDMHGLWFVEGNLIRDFMAFNKIEMLPWDHGTGYLAPQGEGVDEEARYTVMDRVAALTQSGDEGFSEIRALYASDPGFHQIILS